jgi:hypothetical protein
MIDNGESSERRTLIASDSPLDRTPLSMQRYLRTCRATNMMRFRAALGAGLMSCCDILTYQETTDIFEARIDKPDPIEFLMALSFLKTYDTEDCRLLELSCASVISAAALGADRRGRNGRSSYEFIM